MRQLCERTVIPDELVVVQLDEGHGERHLAVRRMLEHLARGLHIVRKRAAAAHAEPLVAAEQQQCGAALGHGQNIFLQRDGGGAEQRHDDEEQRQIWLHQAAKLFIHPRSPLPAARAGPFDSCDSFIIPNSHRILNSISPVSSENFRRPGAHPKKRYTTRRFCAILPAES